MSLCLTTHSHSDVSHGMIHLTGVYQLEETSLPKTHNSTTNSDNAVAIDCFVITELFTREYMQTCIGLLPLSSPGETCEQRNLHSHCLN